MFELIVSCLSLAIAISSCVAACFASYVAYCTLRRETSPDVIAYVAPSANSEVMAYLYIENIGSAPAYDVSFEIEGTVFADRKTEDGLAMFLDAKVPFLPPGCTRKTIVGFFSDFIAGMGDDEATLTVQYYRKEGRKGKIMGVFPKQLVIVWVGFRRMAYVQKLHILVAGQNIGGRI